MKRFTSLLTLSLAIFVMCTLATSRGSALAITKGPYLQNVTQNSIVVIWQTDVASDSRVDCGPTTTYGRSITNSSAVTLHTITVTSLTTNTLYHYRVTSRAGTASTSSTDSTFQTAPASSTAFRFATYGDSRSSPAVHASVIQGVRNSTPRIVLHTGDFVTDGTISSQWQSEFFNPAASLMKITPLYPVLGNHENNASLYYSFFDPPNGGGDSSERWYSFDYGNCHFIVLDTNASYIAGSTQYNWLVNDLKAATAEWIFVLEHHPAYSSGNHGGETNIQNNLVPLYKTYGVDMVFAGHDHIYERSRKDGVYYIVTGGGGATLGTPGSRSNPYKQYSASVNHHCTVDVNGTTAIFRAKRNDGTVFDTVTMTHTTTSIPVANFTASPVSGAAPLSVTFTDTSAGNPTAWQWVFGDGGTSTSRNPIHSYPGVGIFTVSLNASNAVGSNTMTKTGYIQVSSNTSPKTYYCTSLVVDMGSTVSGSHINAHTVDSSYFVTRQIQTTQGKVEQITYTFATGLTRLSALSFAVIGKVNVGTVPQTVSLYNYTTKAWDSKSVVPINTLNSTVQVSVSNPGSYISGGQVQLRVKTTGDPRITYDHYTDLVRIIAAS